jgi:hypothetical protein
MLRKKNRRNGLQPVPVSATVAIAPDGRMKIVLLIEPEHAMQFADRAVSVALDGKFRLKNTAKNTTRKRSKSAPE